MKPKLQNVPLSILLADDDKDDGFFFARALEVIAIPTDLKTVSNGEELEDYLCKNSKHLPDIIFLDLNMPRISGSECLIKIKRYERLKHIPIIINSTCLMDNIADELYQNGAHYYLKKGNLDELTESIYKILTLVQENPKQPSRDKFILSLQKI